MAHVVNCLILKTEADGLEASPYPGELGQRIYENISAEGWRQWLQRLAIIMNENHLSTAEESHVALIEKHMVGFLFGEGDFGDLPSGFTPQGGG